LLFERVARALVVRGPEHEGAGNVSGPEHEPP